MPPLPTVHALSFHHFMRTGRSRPALMLCEEEDGTTNEYVVKFRSDVLESYTSLLFEAFALSLAQHFSLLTPPAAVVLVSPELAEATAEPVDIHAKLTANIGPNFGSRYLAGGYSTVPLVSHIPVSLRAAASDIVAFDGLIANFDRAQNNPNLLWTEDGIVIYDHAQAFRFLVDPLWGQPWLQRLYFLKEHALARGLRRATRGVDFDPFQQRLHGLTDDTLSRMCSELPAAFGSNRIPEICDQLRQTRLEATAFIHAVAGNLP